MKKPTNKNQAEKRFFSRIPYKTEVIFVNEFGDGFLKFESTDLSLSGLFIQTALPLKNKMKVLIKFCLDDPENPLTSSAEIVRLVSARRGPGRVQLKKRKSGIGLRFLGLPPQLVFLLEQFLQKRL